ncbi:MAG TPA: creatininase family protein, partial [Trueperaceae bacterium]
MANILQLSGVERNRLASCQFVILPLGSIEYHGPHAPLGTDTTLAVGFAEALASYFNTIILPPITYTFTPSITSEY